MTADFKPLDPEDFVTSNLSDAQWRSFSTLYELLAP
jgi:hypothetical protein